MKLRILAGALLAGAMATAAYAEGLPIKLADVAELSGGGATVGTNWKNGIDLAVEEINAKGGVLGRKLEVSIIGFADEIAAAASLLQGQAAEAQPVVVVRGLTWTAPEMPVADLIRPPEEDLFQ